MIFEVDNLLHSVMGHQKELSIDGGFVPEKISILTELIWEMCRKNPTKFFSHF